MSKLFNGDRKRHDSVLEFLEERRKRRNGVGNKEEILAAIRKYGPMDPEVADKMLKDIEDAFERIDE